jgi:hypothetical protein
MTGSAKGLPSSQYERRAVAMDHSSPPPGDKVEVTPALLELLQRRRRGPFISGDEMDERLALMIERKRRQYLATDVS